MKVKSSKLIVKHTFLILITILCLYPIVWLFISSFKTNDELLARPWSLPAVPQVENYVNAWTVSGIGHSFINSLIVTAVSLALTLFVSSMASFAMTRMRWRGSKLAMGALLVGMMIPIHATLIPLFLTFTKAKLINTYTGLILPYVAFAMPVSVFILTGFLKSFPDEIEESAVIDGASMIRVFFSIVLPITRSALATIMIYNFVHMWNELVYALVFMNDRSMSTIPVSLTLFKGQDATNYVWMLAAVAISTLPSLLIYLVFNNQIIAGMTSGAIKG